MSRRRPDPDQALFRWVWADDSPGPAAGHLDAPDDDEPAPGPPPLADRARRRREPYVVRLWGVDVTVGRRTSPATDRPNPRLSRPIPPA